MSRLAKRRKELVVSLMKDGIYEAAVRVLTERGAEGLTMDRVAESAGVAKGSLYNYFRSKRDLLEFVYTKTIDPVFQNMEAIVATEQPAIEKLAAQLRGLLEHLAKHAQVHKLLYEDDAAHSLLQSSERRTVEAASQRLAEIFRQGIAEGVFRSADPHVLADMYLGLCKGVLQSRPELDACDQRENVHRLILGTFLNGIATPQGRSVEYAQS